MTTGRQDPLGQGIDPLAGSYHTAYTYNAANRLTSTIKMAKPH